MHPGAILIPLLLALASPVRSICPYHRLWLKAEGAELTNRDATLRRRLLGEGPDPGAGSCTFVNPVSHKETCVQFTGAGWVKRPKKAKKKCIVEGLTPGASDGKYAPGELCKEYENNRFGGVCIDQKGGAQETRTVMTTEGGDIDASCIALETVCVAFVRGVFEGKGGRCEGKEKEKGSKRPATDTSAPCQLNPGIAGGGHMHVDSQWDKSCENQGHQYAIPMRWAAATETIELQRGGKSVGYVYYDAENNRKRQDVVQVEGDVRNLFLGIGNVTYIHDRNLAYVINPETLECTMFSIPVGNVRPTWAIDNHGTAAVSQYLGIEYIMYDGRYRRVRKWRKTEVFEDIYLTISFDEESEWETPEGIKRRVLSRVGPGEPGVGDTVDLYYNHTTYFDDSVFDILKEADCKPVDPVTRSKALTPATGSTIRIDSALDSPVECDECGIIYSHEKMEEKKDTDKKPKTPAEHFSGGKVIRDEPYLELEWEYTPESDTFSFSLKSDGSVGWLGLSFPEFERAMVPSDGVIAASGDDSGIEVAPYSMTIPTISGVVVDNHQKLESAELQQTDEMKRLTFTRKADNGGEIVLDPTDPIKVIWAVGKSEDLAYHGIDERGCLTIYQDAR